MQFQAVAHLPLPYFRVTSLVEWKFLANNELVASFCNCIFLPKGVETRLWSLKLDDNIHALWANVWAVIIYFYTSIHALLELWVVKAVTMVKVGDSCVPWASLAVRTKHKTVNDGTETEPSLTGNYSAYMRAHARTKSWRAVNIWGTPRHSFVNLV